MFWYFQWHIQDGNMYFVCINTFKLSIPSVKSYSITFYVFFFCSIAILTLIMQRKFKDIRLSARLPSMMILNDFTWSSVKHIYHKHVMTEAVIWLYAPGCFYKPVAKGNYKLTRPKCNIHIISLTAQNSEKNQQLILYIYRLCPVILLN